MTDTLDWDYPGVFTISVEVETGQIDGLGHANNAVYVNWCEQAAWAHSESLGLGVADYQRLDRAMAIRSSTYDYLLAAYKGDVLLVGTWLVSSGKVKMERHFQIIRPADRAILLRSQWSLVCIELSSGRAKRIPPEFDRVYLPAVVS